MEKVFYCPTCHKVHIYNEDHDAICPDCSGKMLKTFISKSDWDGMTPEIKRSEIALFQKTADTTEGDSDASSNQTGQSVSEKIQEDVFVTKSDDAQKATAQQQPSYTVSGDDHQKYNPMHTTNVLLVVIIVLLIIVIIMQILSMSSLSLFNRNFVNPYLYDSYGY